MLGGTVHPVAGHLVAVRAGACLDKIYGCAKGQRAVPDSDLLCFSKLRNYGRQPAGGCSQQSTNMQRHSIAGMDG